MVDDLPKYQVKKKHETNNGFIYANCFSPWHGTSGSWIRCFASCLWLVVGDFMVVLVLKGGAVWNLCSKPKLLKSRTQTRKTHASPPQTFHGTPGLPKICATLASLLPWSKGFGLWQGLGRRANRSLEALNKTTRWYILFKICLK